MCQSAWVGTGGLYYPGVAIGDVGHGTRDGYGLEIRLHADKDDFGAHRPNRSPSDELSPDLNAVLDRDAVGQLLDPGDPRLQQAGLARRDGRLAHGPALEGDLAPLGLHTRLHADDAHGHPVLDEGRLNRLDAVVLIECDTGLSQQIADGERVGAERACLAVGDERDDGRTIGGDGTRCQRERDQ